MFLFKVKLRLIFSFGCFSLLRAVSLHGGATCVQGGEGAKGPAPAPPPRRGEKPWCSGRTKENTGPGLLGTPPLLLPATLRKARPGPRDPRLGHPRPSTRTSWEEADTRQRKGERGGHPTSAATHPGRGARATSCATNWQGRLGGDGGPLLRERPTSIAPEPDGAVVNRQRRG